MAALMRQAQAGEELDAPGADAAEAREALRAAILAEAKAEGLVEMRPEPRPGKEDGPRTEDGAGMLPEVPQKA
ncbi:MAG: hypothetical protein ICV69_16185 [Thermoleophilaceae bacterium]|nr:hypothetical protein [Thermoleophilaceae bacterium]